MIIQDIPGMSVIGWGYDVFGRYASPESRMQPLFDFGEMTKVRPEKEEYIFLIPTILKRYWAPYRDTMFEIYTGSTVEKIRTSLASKTRLEGNYGFFSGSLEVGFSSSSLRVTTMRYTQINQLITRWIIQLPEPDVLKGLLLPEVEKDIDGDFESFDLFDKYGTHYLWNLLVGGRISYTSATNSARYKSTYDVGVAAEMSFQSASGGISASNETKYGKSIDDFRQASEIKARARGGKAEYVSAIKTGGITQENWTKWAASIEDYPEFVGYIDNKRQPSLRPIWELCSDEKRMKSLKDAYHEYAEKQPREIKANLYPIYRHETSKWKQRFTLSTTRDPVTAHGVDWSQGKSVFYAYKEPKEGTVPIYQYQAPHEDGMCFGYSYEEDAFGSGWDKGPPAFYAYKEQEEGTIPVRQARADNPLRYAYSTNDVASEDIGEGWVTDHIAFYTYGF